MKYRDNFEYLPEVQSSKAWKPKRKPNLHTHKKMKFCKFNVDITIN